MPTVQFQETLFPKTAREKEEIRVSVGENTTVLLTKIRFLFFFWFFVTRFLCVALAVLELAL